MNNAIDIVRKRCNELLDYAVQSEKNGEFEQYQIIKNFLINDRCFLKVNRLTSINILQILGYSEEESYNLYEDLISYENIKGSFVFEEDKKGGKNK